MVPVPQEPVEFGAQTLQQRIGQAGLVDRDGQPSNFPAPALYLTAQPVGQQLVSQADAQDGHVGFQGLHDPLTFPLEDGQVELVGPVLASGKDHGVIVAQIGYLLAPVHAHSSG